MRDKSLGGSVDPYAVHRIEYTLPGGYRLAMGGTVVLAPKPSLVRGERHAILQEPE
jgi:hypothetical protein